MPITNDGRIYIDSTYGVSIADIQTALRTGAKSDIGGLITAQDGTGKYLVNPFSKIKPFRSSSFTPTDAQRLQALFGTQIPNCGIVDIVSRYSERWAFVPPRGKGGGTGGYDEWFRFLDFNGYQINSWPTAKGENYVRTIFYGSLQIPGSIVSDGDTISFNMQCRENDDADAYPGLLYPYDFRNADSPYDLSQYYLGIVIIDKVNASASVTRGVYVISGPQISDFFNMQGYHVYANMYATIPNVADGGIVIVPVLLQNNTVPSGETEAVWATNYNGTIIPLDGAYLQANKRPGGESTKTTISNVSLDSTSISFDLTIENRTGDIITVYDLVGYLLSNDSEMNEHSSRQGYSGPDYVHPSTGNYIQMEWPSYKQGDIYTHDRTGHAENPDELCARYIMDESGIPANLYHVFLEANNNDNRIGNGNSCTFRVKMNRNMVVNGFVGDEFGPYVDGAYVYLGIHVNQSNSIRQYKII